jgi:neutral ceramidase
MISVRSLSATFDQLKIQTEELLVFEAGRIQINDLEGGFQGLDLLFQRALGTEGTLVIPTCTPSEGFPKPTFDPILSPSEMGPFSEFFRQQVGVIRSHNPTHSIAARGSLAEILTRGHRSAMGRPSPWGEGSFGKGSPWDMLYKQNACWVMLDPNWDESPLTAYIQAVYAEHQKNITKSTPFPRFNISKLEDHLRNLGIVQQLELNGHMLDVFKVQEAVDVILNALENDPERFEPEQKFQEWLSTVEIIKDKGYLYTGVAKGIITPPLSVKRWEGRDFKGVYRDLYARAVVFEHKGQKIAVVLCDLLGISGELVQKIRERAHQITGIAPEGIFIACTHSHSTPDTIGSGFECPEYLESLVETIVNTICIATEEMKPVRMGWGRVPIRGLAHSRRMKMANGKVYTTRYGVPSTWRVDPKIIKNQGQIDPDLTIIRIEKLDGEPMALISNFGCHASVALMSHMISGDFPGEAMAILEAVYGDPCVVLCTNGAAADVDPTLEMPFWGPRNDQNASHLGKIFAAQVLECAERITVEDIPQIAISQQKVKLQVREDWICLLEKEKERMQQEFSKDWTYSSVTNQILKSGVINTEVQTIHLNSLFMVGFPGEIFSDTGLELKSNVDGRAAIAIELSNDNIGYIPTAEAFKEGGYEVTTTLWGRVKPNAERKLISAALASIDELKKSDSI